MKRQTKIPLKSVVGAKGRTYNNADRAAYVEAHAKALARPKDMVTTFESARVMGAVLKHNGVQLCAEHFERAQRAMHERWPDEKLTVDSLMPLAYVVRGIVAVYAVGDCEGEHDIDANLQRVFDALALWEIDPDRDREGYKIVTHESDDPDDEAYVDMAKLVKTVHNTLRLFREDSPMTLDDYYATMVENGGVQHARQMVQALRVGGVLPKLKAESPVVRVLDRAGFEKIMRSGKFACANPLCPNTTHDDPPTWESVEDFVEGGKIAVITRRQENADHAMVTGLSFWPPSALDAFPEFLEDLDAQFGRVQ